MRSFKAHSRKVFRIGALLSLATSMLLAKGGSRTELHSSQTYYGPRAEVEIGSDDVCIRGAKFTQEVSIEIADVDGSLVEVEAVTPDASGGFDFCLHSPFPLGASSPTDFAGRAISIVEKRNGTLLASGIFGREADPSELGVGSATLKPPAGGTFPAASGRLRVKARDGRHLLEVKVRGLADHAVYQVSIVDASGLEVPVGLITTEAGGGGALKVDSLDGGSLPLGAAGASGLAGLTVNVRETDLAGPIVLSGAVPSLGRDERDEAGTEVEFKLEKASGSPEKDIRGDVNLRTEASNDRVRVRIDKAAPGASYQASIRKGSGDSEQSQPLAKLTTSSDGKAEFEATGAKVLPLGATSLADLAGATVEVRNAAGDLVLSGIVPSAPVPPAPPAPVPPLKLVLTLQRPEPPVLPEAHGQVELEEEEDEHVIEAEIEDLVPAQTYRVEIRDGAGGSETLVEGPANAKGDLSRRLDFIFSDRLPLGETSLRALSGDTIVVLDQGGAIVLAGQIVIATGGGGAVPEMSFALVGSFDASFLRGDSNRDFAVDIADPIRTLDALFTGAPIPPCLDAMDANDDGVVDISDPLLTLFSLYLGGIEVPLPGSRIAGFDPTADGLFCRDF